MSSSATIVPQAEATYYVAKNGEMFGPHSVEELGSFLEAGVISSEDFLWAEGMEEWVKIAEAVEWNGPAGSAVELAPEIDDGTPSWVSLPGDGMPVRLSVGMATAIFVHLSLLLILTLGAPVFFRLKADPPKVAAPEPAPLEVAMVDVSDPPPPVPEEQPPAPPPPPDDPPPPPAIPDIPLPTENLPPMPPVPPLVDNVPKPEISPPMPVFAPVAPLVSHAPKRVHEARRAQPVAVPQVATAPADAGPSDYLYAPPPAYPYSARQFHQEGTVMLLVSIDDAGVPVSVNIDKSSGYPILDKVAQNAVQTYRFRVGDNRQLRVPITFVEK